MKGVKCNSEKKVKHGIVNNHQRYTCKNCGYNYTVEQKSTSKPESMKRQALQFYLEGLGFRCIGRFLGVSHVSVYHWVKSFGKKLDTIKSEKVVKVVEIDEMDSYLQSKKTTVGFGLLLTDMGKGSSTSLLVTDRQGLGNIFGRE